MADRDTPYACAVREVTRRCGRAIWSDPGRLRSRLHYEMGSVSPEDGAVLDALVIAAIQGIPISLLNHEDLLLPTLSMSDAVGPLLAAEAVSTWALALTDLDNGIVPKEIVPEEIVPEEPVSDDTILEPESVVPSLLAKLRPPPPPVHMPV